MSDTPSTTTTANDVVLNASIEAQILTAARANLVAADKVIRRNLSNPGPNSHTFAKWQALAATAITGGTSHDAVAATTDGVTVSASLVGIDVLIPDDLKWGAISSLEAGVVDEMGRAVAAKLDSDVLALACGFSSVVGTEGGDLTLTQFRAAISTLEIANAQKGNPSEPGSFGPTPAGLLGPIAFLHPQQLADLREEMATSAASYWSSSPEAAQVVYQNGIVPTGFAGSLYGVPVFTSTAAPGTANGSATAGSGTDNRNGCMIVPSAIGVVVKYLAQYEMDRFTAGRADRHAVTSFYGVGELVDGYGVRIRSDY